MRSPPHPPQTGDLNISLTLENIRNQRKNYIRQLFFFFSFFGNYRSPLKKTKQEKKKDLCWREGTEDFGSKCSVQTRTHLTCAAKSIHPLPCSPFSSSIFTSMVKISSHLSSQLKLNGKSLKKRRKKNLFKSVSSSPSIHISRLQEPVLSSANGEVGGVRVLGGRGGSRPRISLPGALSWWLRRLAGGCAG